MFRIPLDGPGSLSITTRPRGGDWLEDDVAALARQSVGVLVSLLREDEQIELGLELETATCARHNIEFVSIPVTDLSAPVDSNEFILAVHGLAHLLREGRSIAIHCRQSVGRSGLLAVSLAMASGMPLNLALEVVSDARGVRVPETSEQCDWLQRNIDRLSRPGVP
jgi:protein-tyrosine phosphatase